jgi:hypothetical protein
MVLKPAIVQTALRLPMEVDASGAQVSADTKCFQRIINKVEAAP